MKAELLSPDTPSWNAFLRDEPHDFYHLPAYVALCARNDNAEACALHVDDGKRQLLLPLVVRSITRELRDAASPYGYANPLVTGSDDAGFIGRALAAARDALAARQIVSLFVRGHPLLGPPLDERSGTVVEHGYTLSINLTLPAEELWRRTMSGHRNEINKAIRVGQRAFLDERFEHLGTFARIYRETMTRLDAEPRHVLADQYFADLRHALGAHLHLCLVEIDGEIAGGGLFVETGGLLQYHLSGTRSEFVGQHPTKLMLHFVRTWAKSRGLQRLHLGGGFGASEDSLFRFKAGFSTDRHPFRTLRVVLDEPAYADLVRARQPQADPRDHTGFFPLYRKPV